MHFNKLFMTFGFIALVTVFAAAPLSNQVQAAEKTYTNSIGIEFALIPAGSFTMGADKKFEDAGDDETPQRRVTISKPFYLGKYEITQEQWIAVMGNNPSKFKGSNNPVEQVSWEEVQVFIQRLNQKEGTKKYRLPTEAEWEYAAKGGSASTYSFGDDPVKLDDHAWFDLNSDETTHPVGQKKPNAYGLYDMHGNVWEWVQDAAGDAHMSRGGGMGSPAYICRSSSRYSESPGPQDIGMGFRLAISLK